MSLIKYQHIYTFKDNLNTIDLSNDLIEFKNYLHRTNNSSKPTFTNTFTDISYISFDNLYNNNDDVLDLSENSIFRIKNLEFKKKIFKYIQIDFGRYVSLNQFKIYNYLNNEIPFILWRKTSINSNYDTQSDISFSANISHVSSIVVEIYPDASFNNNTIVTTTYQLFPDDNPDGTFNYDNNGNRTLTTTTVRNEVLSNYKQTITTNTTNTTIEVRNINGSITTNVIEPIIIGPTVVLNDNTTKLNDFIYKISYKPILTNKIIYSDPSLPLLNYYYLFDSNYVNYASPTLIRRGLLSTGVQFYGDLNDYYYTLHQFNEHLYNNVIFAYDNLLFDVSSIVANDTSDNYNITFSYRVTINSGSPNDVYIDINSPLFTLLSIEESNFQQTDLSDISVNNLSVKTFYIKNNDNVTINFTYNPYKKANLGYNNQYLNKQYKIIGTTDKIVDKSHLDLSINTDVSFTENVLSYNSNKIIYYENDNTHTSSNYLYSDIIKANELYTNNIVSKNNYFNNITCKNTLKSNFIDSSNAYINIFNVTNIDSKEIITTTNKADYFDLSGNLNLLNEVSFNIAYPYNIVTDDLSKNIIKIYNNSFIDYNSNIYIRKNIFINELSCNNIHCNFIKYNINNFQATNLNIKDQITFKNNVYINGNLPNLLIENTGKLKLAYYGSSISTYNGYRMEVLSYNVDEYNAGWAIKMLGKNNKYCVKDAYIRMLPSISNIMQDVCGNPFKNPISVFEINSDYLKHSSNQTPTQYSDDRVKHNEVDITNGLDTIKKLNPVKYNKSNDINDSKTYFVESGYIAQDVKKINELSHLVFNINNNDQNKLSINYTGIQPFITKSIQELIIEVENMQNRINSLLNN